MFSQLESETAVEQIGKAPEDVPFAIPDKWKWSQLLDVFDVYQPKTISTKELDANGSYFVYGANGIIGKYTRYNHEKSEVVIACRGATCGAVNITKPKSWINGNAMVVRPINNLVCHGYLVAFLKFFNWNQVTSGSAQPQITRKNLSSVLFPVPPIEEQHRIVAKLNHFFNQIDCAEKAYNELSGPLSERFRQLCLEKAIRGKLVPQLESEPATSQIGAKLHDVPFLIPDKWKWVQLRSVGKIVGGGTPKTNVLEYWENGNIPWFTPADLGKITNIYVETSARKITIKGLGNSSATIMPKNSILFSSRAPIGYIALAKEDCCTNQGCKSFVPNESVILPMWAYWVLKARTADIVSRASGTTFKEISGRGMGDTWIPLPPIEEQNRIIRKLKELFEFSKAIQ